MFGLFIERLYQVNSHVIVGDKHIWDFHEQEPFL